MQNIYQAYENAGSPGDSQTQINNKQQADKQIESNVSDSLSAGVLGQLIGKL